MSSYTSLHAHIIFGTKERQCRIKPDLEGRLYDYIGGIVRAAKCQLLAAGGIPDHIHLLARLHATSAVADLVRDIKANSSGWIHETFPTQEGFAWQEGYGAFAVSCSNLDQVRRYIESQIQHHRTMTFQEELVALLKRHGIEYDERYVGT